MILLVATGCNRFHITKHEYVYVASPQVYLHDRVAAVSNRVGLVTNGEALEIIERGKRFIKVKSPKGEIGWLEDHAVIDDKLYAQFQDLAKKHSNDPVVANGQLRDDRNLHILPGRETPHFLLIKGNTKLQLLQRGTIARTATPGQPQAAKAPLPAPTPAKSANPGSAPAAPTPIAPPMEDWWLVRDADGHTGWLTAGRLDVEVPDEVGEYAESQRMVGAYPIAKVTDDGYGTGKAARDERRAEERSNARSGKKTPVAKPVKKPLEDEPAVVPQSKVITEYLTVLSPPRGGLPYDFDQVRLFTWSLNHHRYETGFRLRGIHGYLPVKISDETVNGQKFPVFSFAIASSPDVTIDAETGVTRPVNPRTIAFRLEGNLVRRTGTDQSPIVLERSPDQPGKAKATPKRRKK